MPKRVSVASGDSACFVCRRDELVEAHVHMVPPIARSIAASLPRSFELDDLIATGYVGLLHAAIRYRPVEYPDTPFSAYARVVIRGAILDSVRGRNYVENTRPSNAEIPEPAFTPDMEGHLDAERLRSRVAGAVGNLRPRLRDVIRLHYAEDMSLPAVAAQLNLGESRAFQLHTKAVETLQAKLRRVSRHHLRLCTAAYTS